MRGRKKSLTEIVYCLPVIMAFVSLMTFHDAACGVLEPRRLITTNGPAMDALGDRIEQLRSAVARIQVPQSDQCYALFERVRLATLEALDDAKGSPFVNAGEELPSLEGPRAEEDAEDYGEYAGQMWTEKLLRLIGLLQVRAAQCVTLEEAASAASAMHSAAVEVCDETERGKGDDSTRIVRGLRAGTARLFELMKAGDIIVARQALAPSGAAAFADRLRILTTELTASPTVPPRSPSQIVLDAYYSTFEGDPCLQAARATQADWMAQYHDLEDEFAAIKRATFGLADQEFMKNRARRRAQSGATALQRTVEVQQRERDRVREEVTRVVCVLAIAGATAQGDDQEALNESGWWHADCTLVWTPAGNDSRWFVATYSVAARRANGTFEAYIGLPQATGTEPALPLDIAGVSMYIECETGGTVKVDGLGYPSLDSDLVADAFRALTCSSSGAERLPASLGSIQVFRYPLLGHGFAYGQATLRAASAPLPPADSSPDEIMWQSRLIQAMRSLARESIGDDDIKNARVALDHSKPSEECITRTLRATLLAQIAAHKPDEVEGGYVAAHAQLISLLALPANSKLREHLAKWQSNELPLPLVPATAAEFMSVLGERSECPSKQPAVVMRLIRAFTATGLDAEAASALVERSYQALRRAGIPDVIVSDRWALSAVALVTQAAGAAALPDSTTRQPALDALEWMLLGAGARQSVGGESRRNAWNDALSPLRQELDQLTSIGIENEDSKPALQALGQNVIGGVRWRAGYPCYPVLNFDPLPSWVGRCIELATQRAKSDLERMTPGSSQRWPQNLTADERRIAISFLGGRIHEALITEPEPTAAPHGFGTAQLPDWASTLAITIQDATHPVLTIQRKP